MTPTQHAFAIFISLISLVVIIELVRRRKLKEEYSFFWILTAVGMLVLSSWYGLVEWITRLSGAVTATTTLFIFGLFFLLLISVHFSTVISRLTSQVRRLAQEMAILSAERDEAVARADRAAAGPEAGSRERGAQ